jgi:hypothetical protein
LSRKSEREERKAKNRKPAPAMPEAAVGGLPGEASKKEVLRSG